jgi:hypothetical protein
LAARLSDDHSWGVEDPRAGGGEIAEAHSDALGPSDALDSDDDERSTRSSDFDERLQRRRRYDAHERAAGTHERAADVHEDAAETFERHDRPESAAREHALADKERAKAKRAHDAANEELHERDE